MRRGGEGRPVGGSAEALPYWIQRADFSSRDFDPVPISGALEVFGAHDWRAELAFLDELKSRGDENCAPGIGFRRQAPYLHLLHLCPENRAWTIHYHFGRKGWLWGWRARSETAYNLAQGSAEEALIGFFEGADKRVLAAMGVAAP